MAASRFLVAAAACVMPLSFAAESRELYSSGSIKVAIVTDNDLSADFLNFSACAFPFDIPFQKWFRIQNRSFFALASRSGFGAAISAVIVYKKASLCKTSLCKSLLCVTVQKLSMCRNLLSVNAFLCKSLLCVKAFFVQKLYVCKSLLCAKLSV